MRFPYFTFLFILLLIVCLSCANPEKDYAKVQQLLDSKAQLLQQDMDYDIKIQACNDATMALMGFMERHRNGRWHDSAALALTNWQEKRRHVEEEKDYASLQKTINTSEQVMSASFDYDIKIKCCDDAIEAIQEFSRRHDDSELGSSLQTNLISWRQRKSACQEELKTMFARFTEISRDKAVDLASSQHPMSNIEKIELLSRNKRKEGNKIVLNDIYNVRMVGAFLGTNIFKFDVHVNGYIAMDMKAVRLYDDAYVEE